MTLQKGKKLSLLNALTPYLDGDESDHLERVLRDFGELLDSHKTVRLYFRSSKVIKPMTTATQIQAKFQHQYSTQRVGWDARTGIAIIVDGNAYIVANTWPWGVQFEGSDAIVSYDTLWAAQAVYA